MANDEFKFKEYNIDSKLCRKTTIAPRFGTPPVTLLQVCRDSQSHFHRRITIHIHIHIHTYIYVYSYIHTYIAKVPSGEGIFGYFAFAAKSRVIGMGTFPLTGDPSKVRYPTLTHPIPYLIRQRKARDSRIASVLTQVMGIVAHPGAISSLAISSDGKFLFSAGGPDLSVNMWKVEPSFGRRLRTAESRSIEALSATVETRSLYMLYC